jgi:hypothetical protein
LTSEALLAQRYTASCLRYKLTTVLYVFWIGCILTFMMESALLLTGIRPSGLQVLAYETLILTNQGVPYF